MANPAQEASLADLLQQAGIPLDNGDTSPPDTSATPPTQPVAAMQSNDQVDPTTGAPLPAPDPAMPEAAQTFLGRYRGNHPEAADQSDFQLARGLYDQGLHRPNEAFPQFATRMGVQMGAGETFANQALTTGALHLNQPIEAAAAGVGGMFGGQGFGPAFGQKMQELRDQEDVGNYQHANASGIGDMAGTAADLVGAPGKLLAKGAEMIPGLRAIAKTPLGSNIVKMGGLSGANEAVPAVQDAASHPDGFSWGDLLADESGAVVKGMAAAAAGSAVSKGLTTVVAPLMRGVAGGFDAADSVLRGLPRTIYNKAATRMSGSFVGAGDLPAEAGMGLDKDFYTNLLGKSSINTNKGIAQLSQLMTDDSGVTKQVMSSASDFADANKDVIERGLSKIEGESWLQPDGGPAKNWLTDPDFMTRAIEDPSDQGGYGGLGRLAVVQTLKALQAEDPNLAQRFIGHIYSNLIPARLAGPLDPASAFDRNMFTGSLSDKGKLIQPPVTGMGRLSQALWERGGGGPGRVMWPMLNEPKGMIGGATAVAGNALGLGGKLGGLGLKLGAGVTDALGAPGSYLLSKLGAQAEPPLHSAIGAMPGMWQNYLNTELSNRGGQSDLSAFPDIYHAPVPVSQPSGQQHSEVMQWLGSVDQPTALRYIGSKLGPQVQSQMAQAGDNWKAALFNLASDPRSRAALMPSDEG